VLINDYVGLVTVDVAGRVWAVCDARKVDDTDGCWKPSSLSSRLWKTSRSTIPTGFRFGELADARGHKYVMPIMPTVPIHPIKQAARLKSA